MPPDELKELKIQIATKAFESFSKHQKIDPAIKLEQKLMRSIIHTEREINRSYVMPPSDARERTIDGDQSDEYPPNETAKKQGRSVARIIQYVPGALFEGIGSGFIIAPNILMTNYHVFPNKDYAKGYSANFMCERNEKKMILSGSIFPFNPDIFFLSNKDLDYALVYVESEATTQDEHLSNFGFLPLIATKGKVIEGEPLNIIHYPNGEHKRYSFRDNPVLEIDDTAGNIYYKTDTKTGSSGSPCFNLDYEVAALHFTGVPRIVNGRWQKVGGGVWDPQTMRDDQVDWIANAGRSVSVIVNSLKKEKVLPGQEKYLASVLSLTGDPLLLPLKESNKAESINLPNNKSMSGIIMNFTGSNNIYINPAAEQPVKIPGVTTKERFQPAQEKKERFDENYKNRIGYVEDFIPGFKVPTPTVVESRNEELYHKFPGKEPYILPYIHFSLVMNKKRRMLMWSAANVDYSKAYRDDRKREDFGYGAWRPDPRVPTKYQILAEEFYDPATLIDKGHIVRRDDNCWAETLPNGESDSLGIEYANADTFHWTNCTPQHQAFNRDMQQYKGKWGQLENAIKMQLESLSNDYDNRACVLAGPVLANDDPAYNDIQYPLKFWKVFCIRSNSAGNLVYAFLLDQTKAIDELGLEKVKEGLPTFNKSILALQKSLREIEGLTDVRFAKELHDADQFGRVNGVNGANINVQ